MVVHYGHSDEGRMRSGPIVVLSVQTSEGLHRTAATHSIIIIIVADAAVIARMSS